MNSTPKSWRDDPAPRRTTGPSAGEAAADLADRARRGDEDALRALIVEIHPPVRRWALVRTGDAAEADDLAQEILIRVVRGIGSFRGEARFSTWLYRLVRNTALDRDRTRERRREREEPLEAAAHVADGAEDPLDAAVREALMERVRAAFVALPERQREVFELADLQGLTSVEVAELLEISASTVRVSLLKARRSIRTRILESDPDLVETMLP